jgi:Ca-activated chloride channel family protein
MNLRVNAIFLFLLIFAQLAQHQVRGQGEEVIDIRTYTVLLNVYVTDKNGRPVTELPKNLFSVLENGSEQALTFFEAAKTPFAVAILLDSSGSMEERIVLARAAAIHFLDSLRESDVAAVYSFDSRVRRLRDFEGGRDLPEAFYDLRSRGMTVLYDAILEAAAALGERKEKRRSIIVLSDGADTASRSTFDKALRAASEKDITVYAVDMSPSVSIGVSTLAGQRILKELSERTGGTYIRASGGEGMRDAFQRISGELGVQYTLAYEPTDLKMDGKWRTIEVRIRRPGLQIRTRKGYFAVDR